MLPIQWQHFQNKRARWAAFNYGAQEFYAGNNPYTITNEPFSLDLPTYDQTELTGILKLPIPEQERADRICSEIPSCKQARSSRPSL